MGEFKFKRDKRQWWVEKGVTYSQYGWKRDRACPEHGQRQFSFADHPNSWHGCEPCRDDQKRYNEMCITNQ